MTYTSMRIERQGAVASMVLSESGRGNPIDGTFCHDWASAGIALTSDPSVRAIRLVAEGRNFSVGGDITTFVRNLDGLPALIKAWAADFHAGTSRFQRGDAPLVAAVHGVCAGGAVAVIAGADYVVAEAEARFVSAYAGLGFCCDGGASVLLSRRMGQARAKRFLMMRETLSAEQALAAGLIDEIVPADDLAARSAEVAEGLAAGPTRAFGELKRLFVSVGDTSLETQLELEALALARCSGTADAREAITAFAEKRKPRFEGR
jgi:2-(1,2-epoxy-1,2-dihydrophenyl)acetyl-CoA isomerase